MNMPHKETQAEIRINVGILSKVRDENYKDTIEDLDNYLLSRLREKKVSYVLDNNKRELAIEYNDTSVELVNNYYEEEGQG